MDLAPPTFGNPTTIRCRRIHRAICPAIEPEHPQPGRVCRRDFLRSPGLCIRKPEALQRNDAGSLDCRRPTPGGRRASRNSRCEYIAKWGLLLQAEHGRVVAHAANGGNEIAG